MQDLIVGEPGSRQRRRIAAALIYGSPCFALLHSFSVIVISRSLADPIGWYAFDPVMAANGVLAVAGSVAGGLLRNGPTTSRIVGAIMCGIFTAVFYASATFRYDLQTDWI